MAAKTVQVQRVSKFGQWVTIKRVGRPEPRPVSSALSKGVNRLRIAMSVNQAGVGYLAGFSHEIVWRRAG